MLPTVSEGLSIVAPPGARKTERLAELAVELSKKLENKQKILVLTFTNRARSNLEDRIKSKMRFDQAAKYIEVHNFHGFAAKVVLAHGRTLGLDPCKLKLPNNKFEEEIRSGYDLVPGQWNKTFNDAKDVLAKLKRQPHSDSDIIRSLEQDCFSKSARVALEIEQRLQRDHQLDYTDLLRHAQRLLRIPAVARLYQAHYGALLVDEFQDLSLQQLEVAVNSCTSRRVFAGDPNQGIFSWAGSDLREVQDTINGICRGNVERLTVSYRSSPAVLDMVSGIGQDIDPTFSLAAADLSRWPDGGCSAKLVSENVEDEAQTVFGLARQIVHSDPEASVAIISRNGRRQEKIRDTFSRQSDVTVYNWISAMDNPRIISVLGNLAARLPLGATVEDARAAVRQSVDGSDVDLVNELDAALELLCADDDRPITLALQDLKDLSGTRSVGSGVHILNAHQGKGHQFDWVFALGIEQSTLPAWNAKDPARCAEEERTLFVMLSRAKRGVIATRVNTLLSKNGRPYSAHQSVWWRLLQAKFDSGAAVEEYIAAMGPSLI